jgi:hypothetical protein
MSKKEKTQTNDIGTINNNWKGREKKKKINKTQIGLVK